MSKTIKEKSLGGFKYILKYFEGDKKYVIIALKNSSSVTRGLPLEIFSNEETAMNRFNKIGQYVYWCGHCDFSTNSEVKIKVGSDLVINQKCPKCGDNKYLIGEKDFENN